MSCYPSLETHPLKCLKLTEGYNSQKVILGPPDVYQQEYKQKEDLLTEANVREGFSCSKHVIEEHESAKDIGFDFVSRPFLTDLNNYMQAVIMKSHNNNIKQDTTKRKSTATTLYKDLQCIPALEKSKEIIYDWMVNLSDTIPYAELINKRIPYFHKKEDVLKEIFRHQVPITRAIWFIKVSAMHATIQAESNKKKTRSNVDSSSDWVISFTRILSEKLDVVRLKLVRNEIDHEYDITVSEFEYLMRLMVAMYDEDLLDHTDVLQWLVMSNERCADDEQVMKFYLPFLLFFGDRFKESEFLTRRLLFGACHSLNVLLTSNKSPDRAITDFYSEYSSCPLHRTVIFCLSGLIISLSLQCPCAVVWNNVKIPGHHLNGSPLDILPCSLTALPSPPGHENTLNRETIAKLEHFVLQRSLSVENQWKHESFECPIEQTAASLIKVLDLLDRYDYNCYKDSNAIQSLSASITNSVDDHTLLLMLLCEWAVTPLRTGVHRAIIVANVIEHLRQQLKQSLQQPLIQFLDSKAPCIDTVTTVDSEAFRSLVCLFGELIEREIFSPNEYMSYMIARGLFESVPNLPIPPIAGFNQFSSSVTCKSPEPDRTSTDNPDSVRSECSGLNTLLGNTQQPTTITPIDYRQYSRHLQFLMHFPMPHNEEYLHEHNLRTQKLYCSSRTRDSNKQFLRRLAKDISKLFSKRGYMFDIIQIEKVRRKSRRDPREESLLIDRLSDSIQSRFRGLTYYDMECVLAQCVPSCVNSLNIVAILSNKFQSMTNMFLPYPRIINMLLGLIEQSCNYRYLIKVIDGCCVNVNKLIDHFSRSGVLSSFSHVAPYCSYFRMHIIGFLLKYQSILMFMNESRSRIFLALFNMVRNVPPVGAATHVYINRCTFSLIYTLYQSCAILKSQLNFSPYIKKIESTLFRMIKPDRERSSNIDYIDSVASELLKGNMLSLPDLIAELQNNVSVRLSFVLNCIVHISHCTDIDQLALINTVIVETAVNVPSLNSEWMTAIFSLLMPYNPLPGYEGFAAQFNSFLQSNDSVFYENISTLIATLLARQCFTFVDFLSKVICVVMAQGIDQQTIVSAAIVPTTRLASYILFRLFTMDQLFSANAPSLSQTAFKLEDVNLLTCSLQKVSTELLVDLLKMLAVHSDKGRLQDQDIFDLTETNQIPFGAPFPRSQRTRDHSTDNDDAVSNSNVTMFSTMKIWNFTLRVLREICCVSWVRIKFCQETPSRLIRDNVLIDKNISNSQARNLLNIICQPREHLWQTSCTSRDIIDTMSRTFSRLCLWSLHFDQMKIQLLLTQIPDDERKEVIDTVSKDIVTVFKHQAEQQLSRDEEEFMEERKPRRSIEIHSAYLIPSLINKLPFDNFKRQLIVAAAEKLESGKHFCSHKNYQDKENDLVKSSLILTYSPFISLLVVCLSRDDNRAELLKSLADQIEFYIDNAKETEKMPDDLRVKHLIHTTMRSRLALVGYLFERIQDSVELISDWCLLLCKLIIYGVVEMHADQAQLFYTVLDMIGSLMHSLYSHPSVGLRFSQTIKKLRKEIADKLNYEGVELIKPFLLPCFKNTYDVVVTVPLRMAHKAQQYRLTAAEKSGKHGCAVQRKERMNPWEVIDGIKNLFSLSWFAAVGCDTPVLPIEEQANLMIGHDHPDRCMIHGDSYYTANPEVPHEDVRESVVEQCEQISAVAMGNNNSNSNNIGGGAVAANIDGTKIAMDNNVNVNSNCSSSGGGNAMQQSAQQRPRSNASSGVSATKKGSKKPKRSSASSQQQQQQQQQQQANAQLTPGHFLSRGVSSPASAGMLMRHPHGGMAMVPPSGPLVMSLPHGYAAGPPQMEYASYQAAAAAHQLGPGIVEMQQHSGGGGGGANYLQQRQQQQHFSFDASRAGMGIVRANRPPRPNIVTQGLKTKLERHQRQDSGAGMHPGFPQQQQQQSIGLPPPYPSSGGAGTGGGGGNAGGHEQDMGVVGAGGAPPNYSAITNSAAMMSNYPMNRAYSDSSIQQFMVQQQHQQQQQQQQQSRIHSQQYNRYAGPF